jgi:NIMA (never in mitosis gene a)-related kinase
MIRNFNIIRKLGEGSFGCVYLAKRLTDGKVYALKKVKLLSMHDKDKKNSLNEVRLMASIKHTNIIEYKEAFIDDSSGSLCLIMEYAEKGDLIH